MYDDPAAATGLCSSSAIFSSVGPLRCRIGTHQRGIADSRTISNVPRRRVHRAKTHVTWVSSAARLNGTVFALKTRPRLPRRYAYDGYEFFVFEYNGRPSGLYSYSARDNNIYITNDNNNNNNNDECRYFAYVIPINRSLIT